MTHLNNNNQKRNVCKLVQCIGDKLCHEFNLSGVGNGLMFLTGYVIIQRVYRENACFPCGLYSVSTGIAYSGFNYVETLLLTQSGYRGMLIVNGEISLFCVAVGIVIIYIEEAHYDMSSPSESKSDKQETQLIVNESTGLVEKKSHTQQTGEKTSDSQKIAFFDKLLKTLVHRLSLYPYRDPGFYLLIFVFFGFPLVFMGSVTYIPLTATRVTGVSEDQAIQLAIIFGVCITVARIPVMVFSGNGYVWRRNMCISSFVIGGVASLLITYATTYTMDLIYCLLTGIYLGNTMFAIYDLSKYQSFTQWCFNADQCLSSSRCNIII